MISGQRVTLRPIGNADREVLRRWQSAPGIMREWGFPPSLVSDDVIEHDRVDQFENNRTAGSLVADTENGLVGRIHFDQLDERHGSVQVALYVGAKGSQQLAHAIDMLRTLSTYLIGDRGLHRVEAIVPSTNEQTLAAYRAVGFKIEGRLRDYTFADGAFLDQTLLALHVTDVQDDAAK